MSKKEKKEKKQKKEKEVYTPKTGVMGNADDYHVYHLSFTERLTGFAIGGLGSAVVLYIFFGSLLLSLIALVIVGVKAIPIYQNYLLKKRKKTLLFQFRDMLESLTSSFSAGKNTRDSFIDTLQDMKNMYGEDADIVKELTIIVSGMENNINPEILLLDFADRSELTDVESFASVFDVALRQGADLKVVIASTKDMISDKMEIELEMDAMLAGNKNEINVMMLMPLIITVSLKGMSGETFGNSMTNIIVKCVAIALFIVAYAMGRKISDIKI